MAQTSLTSFCGQPPTAHLSQGGACCVRRIGGHGQVRTYSAQVFTQLFWSRNVHKARRVTPHNRHWSKQLFPTRGGAQSSVRSGAEKSLGSEVILVISFVIATPLRVFNCRIPQQRNAGGPSLLLRSMESCSSATSCGSCIWWVAVVDEDEFRDPSHRTDVAQTDAHRKSDVGKEASGMHGATVHYLM